MPNEIAITYKALNFSDNTTIELDAEDVIVFVGPNNCGKSLALQELESHFDKTLETLVVRSAMKNFCGSSEEFERFLYEHVKISTEGPRWRYRALGLNFDTETEPVAFWPNYLTMFKPLFCKRLTTETRISDSDRTEAIDVLNESPVHPIQMLYSNDTLETRISGYFRKAFGADLTLDHGAGRVLPLHVGEAVSREGNEDRVSSTYLERLRENSFPLDEQGDGMRSFASVVLHLLAPTTFSMLLLDEPEAFLHPPQAHLLGEIIAVERPLRSQLYLATHSPDVLQGLLHASPRKLRILRMQRQGNVNRVRELDGSLVEEIANDPLMKYSAVLSGLFHERVIICESDADCLFYSTILHHPEVCGETHPDVLFIHGSGKDRLAKLARVLVALDVRVDIVVDMDVLRDLNEMRRMVEALGGDWNQMNALATAVAKEIESVSPTTTLNEAKDAIRQELDDQNSGADSVSRLRSRINKILGGATPWGAAKKGGKNILPGGDASLRYNGLEKFCRKTGLWIVPVGELERFCKSIGGKGSAWVQRVTHERDLATDAELREARVFVKELWEANRL